VSSKIFPNSQPYDTGYCVLFVRDISPADLLSALSEGDAPQILLNRLEADAIKMFGEDIEDVDVPDLDVEELRSSGMLDNSGPLLRAGTHNNWAFVIEAEGAYLAKDELLTFVSRSTTALSARLSETGSTWIAYAENGEILSSFDPLFPDQDYGKRPAALEELTGYREAIRTGDRAEAYENALRKIQKELQCNPLQEADTPRLLAVRIPGVY
jgi:hypothetical protein